MPRVNVAPELRLLPDETLSELRALTEANLSHRCSATTALSTGTRIGGALVQMGSVTAVVLDRVPCRLVAIKRLPKPETLNADQPFAQDQWNVVFRVGVVIAEGALATITGTDALGVAWTRVVRIGTPIHGRAYEVQSRYGARDVNVARR